VIDTGAVPVTMGNAAQYKQALSHERHVRGPQGLRAPSQVRRVHPSSGAARHLLPDREKNTERSAGSPVPSPSGRRWTGAAGTG